MHLNEQDIAAAAEALSNGTYDSLDAAIKAHLQTCDQCAAEVQTSSIILDDVQGAKKSPKRRPRLAMVRIASGVAASALLTFGAWHLIENKSDDTSDFVDAYTTQDSLETLAPLPHDQFAKVEGDELREEPLVVPVEEVCNNHQLMAYQSHKEMEALVARFEEGALRGDNITFLMSATIEGIVGEVTIEWENPDNKELIFEFFNNRGEKLFEVTTQDNHYQPLLQQPGLFYYKVLSEDFDLLFCGRIKVVDNP